MSFKVIVLTIQNGEELCIWLCCSFFSKSYPSIEKKTGVKFLVLFMNSNKSKLGLKYCCDANIIATTCVPFDQ